MKFLILVLLISFSSNLLAVCKARWQKTSLRIDLERSHNPVPLNILINGINNKECKSLKIMSDSNNMQRILKQGSENILMNIYTDATAENIFPLRTISAQGVTVASRNNSTFLVNLFTRIDSTVKNTQHRAGNYEYKESFSLYDENELFLDRVSITFILDIPLEMDIKLVRPGTNTEIGESLSFKQIENGESVEVDTLINSNIGYSLWMESENSGRLNHESLNEQINYVIYKDNQNIGQLPSQKYQAVQNLNQTSQSGERVNFRFQINQETDKKPAGEYLDVIRVNIQSEM